MDVESDDFLLIFVVETHDFMSVVVSRGSSEWACCRDKLVLSSA